MTSVLLITASPRAGRSTSLRLGQALAEALAERRGEPVERLDLWQEPLPAFSGALISAKYARLSGAPHGQEEAEAWQRVEAMVGRLAAASAVVIATPMWNFSIPYRLKHYIDLVTQPGLTFRFSEDTGYSPLLAPRPTYVVLSSAGDYRSGTSRNRPDLATPYLTAALGFIGLGDVTVIPVGPTVAPAAEVAAGLARAEAAIRAIAGGVAA